jgi:hypothetical protein
MTGGAAGPSMRPAPAARRRAIGHRAAVRDILLQLNVIELHSTLILVRPLEQRRYRRNRTVAASPLRRYRAEMADREKQQRHAVGDSPYVAE